MAMEMGMVAFRVTHHDPCNIEVLDLPAGDAHFKYAILDCHKVLVQINTLWYTTQSILQSVRGPEDRLFVPAKEMKSGSSPVAA